MQYRGNAVCVCLLLVELCGAAPPVFLAASGWGGARIIPNLLLIRNAATLTAGRQHYCSASQADRGGIQTQADALAFCGVVDNRKDRAHLHFHSGFLSELSEIIFLQRYELKAKG